MTDAGRLWAYAVVLHRAPGVEAACLTLQDKAGADVLLLLAACHAEATSRPLSADDIAALRSLTEAWRREVVRPLRQVRRRLKPAWPGVPDGAKSTLREDVKALERGAERIELRMIEDWLRDHAGGSGGLPLRSVLEMLSPAPDGDPAIAAARLHLAQAAGEPGR